MLTVLIWKFLYSVLEIILSVTQHKTVLHLIKWLESNRKK